MEQQCVCTTVIPGQPMVNCDICKQWYHGQTECSKLPPDSLKRIEKYHCPRCEPLCGPSIFHEGDKISNSVAFPVGTDEYTAKMKKRQYAKNKWEALVHIKGEDLNVPAMNEYGFRKPLLISEPESIGIKVADNVSFSNLASLLPDSEQVNVYDVQRQQMVPMTPGDLCKHFAEEASASSKCLEYNSAELSRLISPPDILKKVCWVRNMWPSDARGPHPNVQGRCVFSSRNSCMDFRINPCGASSWHYVHSGEVVFYLVEPSAKNLTVFEQWNKLSQRTLGFFGDDRKCYEVVVNPQETIFLPAGWIYSMLTVQNSIFFYGTFVHTINSQIQMRMYDMEDRMCVPMKARFPAFQTLAWLAAHRLKEDLEHPENIPITLNYLKNVKSLAQTLKVWSHNPQANGIPEGMDAEVVVRDLGKQARLAEKSLTQSNPPRPERESKREKRPKKISDDFIDISKGSLASIGEALAAEAATPPPKRQRGGAQSKIPPLKVAKVTATTEENGASSSGNLKLKISKYPATNNYDLTDRDAVRQLLGSGKQTSTELNAALNDALEGFGEEEGLTIDERPAGQRKKSIKVKLTLNKNAKKQRKNPFRERSMEEVVGKYHQEGDFIYPNIETEEADREDTLWSPKAKNMAQAAAKAKSSTKKSPSLIKNSKVFEAAKQDPKKVKGMATAKQRLVKKLKLKL